MTTLEVTNVGMIFIDGFEALSDINLDVSDGEFLTLLGPSGCGKTTFLKTLAGFHLPTSGRIEIGGVDVTRAPPERRDTAMCFQSYALFPHLSVAENIDFGPRQKGVPRAERMARLDGLLEQVALESQRAKLPDRLSGGQQQRVALARALAIRPSVMLFDEPLSNLDAKLRDQVRREIRMLQRDAGFTAIYVTHDQAEALAMSDRIVVMRAGRIEQIGTPEDIYRRPSTTFVADFVGAANLSEIKSFQGHSAHTSIGVVELGDPPTNKATHLCWRPEDAIQVSETDAGANIFAGTVVSRAFQGAFTEVYVMLDADQSEVRLHLHSAVPEIGGRLHFRLPPERLTTVSDNPQ